MAKRKISKDQLLVHKAEHLQFIAASSSAFDEGQVGEAKRIAVSLRVLFHQTAQSHSILAQLGERNRDMIAFAYPYDPANLLTHHGLVGIRMDVTVGFYALNVGTNPVPPRPMSFKTWWDEDVVLKDADGRTYTRRELVLYAANKDGGAHVDPGLDDSYSKLKDGAGAGWLFTTETGDRPLPDVMAHSIRQIAFETLSSVA